MNKNSYRNSTAILPAGKVCFGKLKVSLNEIADQWKEGTVVVCKKENGQLHFIAGASTSGLYFNIGDTRDFHHDQTGAYIGTWTIINQISYRKLSDGNVILGYVKEPAGGEKDPDRAPLHVFK